MASWREDERFRCPLCTSLVQIKFLYRPESMPKVQDGILAICCTCERAFSMAEWRAARRDPEGARQRYREHRRRLRLEIQRRRASRGHGDGDGDELPF